MCKDLLNTCEVVIRGNEFICFIENEESAVGKVETAAVEEGQNLANRADDNVRPAAATALTILR